MHVIDLVQTNPKPGQEEEFNAWYSTHIYDLLKVPGILSAQRYRWSGNRREEGEGYEGMPEPFQHIVIYETNGEPAQILKDIERLRNAGEIPWSPALDPIFSAFFYESIGEKVMKGDKRPD